MIAGAAGAAGCGCCMNGVVATHQVNIYITGYSEELISHVGLSSSHGANESLVHKNTTTALQCSQKCLAMMTHLHPKHIRSLHNANEFKHHTKTYLFHLANKYPNC
jgi:hypothetical protein